MTESLIDFPPIEAAPPVAAPAPLAAVKSAAIADSISAVHGEVAKFDQIAAGLARIEAAHPKNVIVADISTPAGYKVAETGWRAYRNPRLEVERARKAAKAPVLALGKAIDTFAGELETRLRDGEDHYKAQLDAEEIRRAAEKAERERIEAERIAKHRAGIAKIGAYLTRCQEPGMTADRISIGIGMLEGVTFGPEWEEFAVPAANAQCETLEAMRALHAKAVEREVEAARLEAQRIENERIAAELAEQRRQLAEQQAEVERQRAELARQEEAKRAAELQEVIDAAKEMERVLSIPLPLTIPDEYPEGQEGQQVLKAEGAIPDATDRATPADASPRVGAMGVGQAADAAPAAEPLLQDECRELSKALAADPAASLHAREAAAAIASQRPEPTMTLGDINAWLAPLKIDGAGLESLGFPAAGRRKAAMLYHASDKDAMVMEMVKHLRGSSDAAVRGQQPIQGHDAAPVLGSQTR